MRPVRVLQYRIAAVTWFVVMTILFLLPGSSLPRESWLDTLRVDKLAHVGLFAVLVFLCCGAFYPAPLHPLHSTIILSIIYGLMIEIIQGLWIANRSFDFFDLASDTIGVFAGFFVWLRVYKKINPCRNRGRNQN